MTKIIHKYDNLMEVKVINRPSKKVKSPYLADVLVNNKNEMAHSPGLGLCGFIATDSTVAISTTDNPKRKSKYTVEYKSKKGKNPIPFPHVVLKNKKKVYFRINYGFPACLAIKPIMKTLPQVKKVPV